jgi:hypothetical protein
MKTGGFSSKIYAVVLVLGSRSLPAQETILKWDNIGTYL